jgi:hypothetical protein
MRIMKAENFEFPVFQESDAMFTADNAPEWVDGDKCHRCRVAFSTFMRKHHCRACGQVFCGQCSAKSSTLPKYGIEKEVRVCDTCYDQVNKLVYLLYNGYLATYVFTLFNFYENLLTLNLIIIKETVKIKFNLIKKYLFICQILIFIIYISGL